MELPNESGEVDERDRLSAGAGDKAIPERVQDDHIVRGHLSHRLAAKRDRAVDHCVGLLFGFAALNLGDLWRENLVPDFFEGDARAGVC